MSIQIGFEPEAATSFKTSPRRGKRSTGVATLSETLTRAKLRPAPVPVDACTWPGCRSERTHYAVSRDVTGVRRLPRCDDHESRNSDREEL